MSASLSANCDLTLGFGKHRHIGNRHLPDDRTAGVEQRDAAARAHGSPPRVLQDRDDLCRLIRRATASQIDELHGGGWLADVGVDERGDAAAHLHLAPMTRVFNRRRSELEQNAGSVAGRRRVSRHRQAEADDGVAAGLDHLFRRRYPRPCRGRIRLVTGFGELRRSIARQKPVGQLRADANGLGTRIDDRDRLGRRGARPAPSIRRAAATPRSTPARRPEAPTRTAQTASSTIPRFIVMDIAPSPSSYGDDNVNVSVWV